jgi:hypothetical protein
MDLDESLGYEAIRISREDDDIQIYTMFLGGKLCVIKSYLNPLDENKDKFRLHATVEVSPPGLPRELEAKLHESNYYRKVQ